MAEELDKFVLQYTVEIKDAVARLEELNKKVSNTTKNAKSGKSEFKEFAAGAADEIGKVVPGVDKVSAAVKALSVEFAAAGVAVGVLAVGVKSLLDMRQQYNQQRKEGMDIGVSAMRLEEYQRKFVKNSDGKITREQTSEEVKKISQFASAIYKDPTRIGTEARTAKVLGIDVGEPGQHVSVNSLMTQLGEKFSKMTDAQVQAQAKTLGISQDFALSLKKQGGSVGKVTEMTTEEIDRRKGTQKQLKEFDDAMAKLNESFTEAKNVVGEKLLPPFTKFVQKMADLAEFTSKNVGSAMDTIGEAWDRVMDNSYGFGKFRSAAKAKEAETKKPDSDKKVAEANTKAAATTTKAAEKTSKSIDALISAEDEDNAAARNIADQQGLAINQFAGAVASFSNAVDEKQAWAAWAGEVGRASGLNAPATSEKATNPVAVSNAIDLSGIKQSPIQNKTPEVKKTAFDELFKEAGTKYGLDANLLKNIARVESGFNPRIVSGAGATGLMQIMPANFKSLGITDATDPKQNIMGGAKLFSDFLKAAKGDLEKALMMYHGGFDQSGWGKLTRAYPEKVLSTKHAEKVTDTKYTTATGELSKFAVNRSNATERIMANDPIARRQDQPSSGVGESKDKINLKSVQNTIAQRLGIPVQQLQRGEWSRGDVQFASSQIEKGMQNQIYDLKNQLKAVNLPQQTMSKLLTELRTQQTGLQLMRQYSPEVIDKARPGERMITIGERAIVINVNGAMDPSVTAEHVKSQLDDHLGEIVNGTATGMKY